MSDDWNMRVWELVQLIPPGRVATYGQLAAMLGHPRRSRHVGRALRTSPEGMNLPWHRVLNASGRISFSPHTEHWHIQKAKLTEEGVLTNPEGKLRLRDYQWRP